MKRNKRPRYLFTACLVGLAAMVLLSALPGCAGVNKPFVKAVEKNWNVMGPDYTKYVQGDPNLPEESKLIRLQAIAEFTLLVAEAVDQVGDEK